MSKPGALSPLQMREQIKQLNRLDLTVARYETIKAKIDAMRARILVSVGPTRSDELYFRVRVNPGQKLLKVADICAPPPEAVTRFGRCNSPGNPMFYCASRRITALLECNVQAGDTVYLSQWIGKAGLPINKGLCSEEDQNFVSQLTTTDHMIYSWMDTVFVKPVAANFTDGYKISAAIVELHNKVVGPAPDLQVEDDGWIGFRYPSVVDIERSYNTVFPPHFATDRMELLHVMELHVVEREGNRVEISPSDTANDFSDGLIHWTGDALALPVVRPETRGVLFRHNGTRPVLATYEDMGLPKATSLQTLSTFMDE